MPNLGSEAYAPMMPKWATNMLRLLSLGFAVGSAWLAMQEWHRMPLFAQVIMAILPPAMLYAAAHPKGWATLSTVPFFLADRNGLYFKHKMADVTHLGKDAESKNALRAGWLFVPWEHISNIRIEKVRGNEGTVSGGVLDVQASEDELKDFFGHWQYQKSGEASVAFYVNIPPSPRTVVAQVQEMMGRYKKSALSVQYSRFK